MRRALAVVSIPDSELMANVADGDLQSLGQLFDRYEPHVKRLVVRLGVAVGDADDVVQDTFLEVVRTASRFDRALPVKNWLLGLAVMLVRRRRRSLSRLAARLLQAARLPSPAPPTPAVRLEHNQQLERLERAFAALSAKKREVFALVTLEGLSHEEVSRALDLPVATVRTRLHHARLELRASLDEVTP
ncbi:MAG TPA: RNA polymerase sigma factor [Polyangiaceae bacterium]|nr:RNA polymerase sigma factor [Polyangiaceae bacterium]